MRNLTTMLYDADPALLHILAKRWGVSAGSLSPDKLIEALTVAMLDRHNAEKIYDSLDENQRGVLQTLNGFKDRKMPGIMFEKMFGEIRMMGAGRIEREKPHENPANLAESLYYLGLIGRGNDKVGGGIGPIFYIPDDLAGVLPTHKTGYSAQALEVYDDGVDEGIDGSDAPSSADDLQVLPLEDIEPLHPADTSIIDDFTTLLAYLQLHSPAIDARFTLENGDAMLPMLLVADANRQRFMVAIGVSAGLIEIQGGKAYPRRAEVRRWLAEKRALQLKWLVDAWVKSLDYLELWHTPGLYAEAGWTYDPVAARQAVFELLRQTVPRAGWWAIDDFIDVVKAKMPNFQRPGGDYESWYIRSESNEYLHGVNSWDAVEGAVLSFYLIAPMHWLGLTDVAEDAVRFSAYGRVFIDPSQAWLQAPDPEDKIIVQPDATLIASRKVSRVDRFQLARFTTWVQPATLKGDPYLYRLDGDSIQQAAAQGITTEHISTFIKRILDGAPMPPAMGRLLETWQGGASATVSVETLLVLRTTAPETLDALYNEPAIRRYLGARLGQMAVIVRADQKAALLEALAARGVQVDLA